MLKKTLVFLLALCVFFISGCNSTDETTSGTREEITLSVSESNENPTTNIALSDKIITVNGEFISNDTEADVYLAQDIIYYESNRDAAYGEGTEADAHSPEEAASHDVIHITKPGVYKLSGNLSQGQIFVDLGDDAKNNPAAVVTLILDGFDITCDVAPAIFFYNVYECGVKDEASATATVDTSSAGANVIIADDSINNVNGAYVARIYEPGTTDKLHKYDGAFYSKRSMNINGEEKGNGVLHIEATNEGLGSEMHLTINGGNITITSQNDGINTNEDNISVTTINGGALTINAGLGAEGDGIDSNGFIVINGGAVLTSSCDKGPDGGIDADRDIIINGGIVMACGNQNGTISSDSKQEFMQISVQNTIPAGASVKLLDGENSFFEFAAIKSCTALVLSSPAFEDGKLYTMTVNDETVNYNEAGGFGPGGMGGMQPPMGEGFERPEMGGRFNEMPTVPEGLDEWLNSTEMPDEIREWIESMKDMFSVFEGRGGNMQPREDMRIPNA